MSKYAKKVAAIVKQIRFTWKARGKVNVLKGLRNTTLGPSLRRRVIVILGALGSVASIVSLALYFFPVPLKGPSEGEVSRPAQIGQIGTSGLTEETTLTEFRLGEPANDLADGEIPEDLPGTSLRYPRVGDTFVLEAGQEISISDIQTVFALREVELGTQKEGALRIGIIPPGDAPISRDLIGDSGRIDFEAQGEGFRVVLSRLGGQRPRVSFTVTRRSKWG